ncbi:hypothetical protein [Mesorhizobium sp. NZP2077]|uniref:hypothetical protein n=1 Tax=Mesorhizobium sp. NZP2077 TaxID=2483404 RepID=UPI00155645EA|nr:hypothetical protein HGP13_31825 [Mesorhizobium sp. NZP2077]
MAEVPVVAAGVGKNIGAALFHPSDLTVRHIGHDARQVVNGSAGIGRIAWGRYTPHANSNADTNTTGAANIGAQASRDATCAAQVGSSPGIDAVGAADRGAEHSADAASAADIGAGSGINAAASTDRRSCADPDTA